MHVFTWISRILTNVSIARILFVFCVYPISTLFLCVDFLQCQLSNCFLATRLFQIVFISMSVSSVLYSTILRFNSWNSADVPLSNKLTNKLTNKQTWQILSHMNTLYSLSLSLSCMSRNVRCFVVYLEGRPLRKTIHIPEPLAFQTRILWTTGGEMEWLLFFSLQFGVDADSESLRDCKRPRITKKQLTQLEESYRLKKDWNRARKARLATLTGLSYAQVGSCLAISDIIINCFESCRCQSQVLLLFL